MPRKRRVTQRRHELSGSAPPLEESVIGNYGIAEPVVDADPRDTAVDPCRRAAEGRIDGERNGARHEVEWMTYIAEIKVEILTLHCPAIGKRVFGSGSDRKACLGCRARTGPRRQKSGDAGDDRSCRGDASDRQPAGCEQQKPVCDRKSYPCSNGAEPPLRHLFGRGHYARGQQNGGGQAGDVHKSSVPRNRCRRRTRKADRINVALQAKNELPGLQVAADLSAAQRAPSTGIVRGWKNRARPLEGVSRIGIIRVIACCAAPTISGVHARIAAGPIVDSGMRLV
jgi:hypothetical protein